MVSVVRGEPTDTEVAAVVAVLIGRSAPTAAAASLPRPEWSARSRLVRQPLRPGRGAWRASALPR